MGFIEAFKGAIGGSFADQWKDFYTVPTGVSDTVAIFPSVKIATNADRGTNLLASDNIITNGSRILVPEGYAVLTVENGQITGFCAAPGGYEWSSDSINSQSFLSGGGIFASVFTNSWQRFKFGGIPGDQQLAFFINLKEIPNNRFGTQSEIYWDDAFLGTQAGAVTRGTYTLRIVDPILFVKGFVPVQYYSANATVFDFADFNNDAATQLFNEVVQSLSAAFSLYTNDPSKGNRITRLQSDSVGFAQSLAAAVETNYQWAASRGLAIVKTALQAIEYDEKTKALLSDVQKADALAGARGNAFRQQAVARGIEAAGSNPQGGGAIGLGMMGMGIGATTAAAEGTQLPNTPATGYPGGGAGGGAMVGGVVQLPNTPAMGNPFVAQAVAAEAAAAANAAANAAEPPRFDPQTGQPLQPAAPVAAPAAPAAMDPYEELTKLKGLLDAGIITQQDFDAKKAQLLGL